MKRLKSYVLFLLLAISGFVRLDAKEQIVRILAIGNSFSEDAVCQNLFELASADGNSCIIANMYIGGCSLQRHWNNASTDAKAYRYRKIGTDGITRQTDKMCLDSVLRQEKWDYVSLQQSSGLSGIESSYSPYLSQLVQYIRKRVPSKTKIIWHQTWAYSQDASHGDFVKYERNQMKMYQAIMNASHAVMKDKHFSRLVPCGTAIQNARSSFIGDAMNRDGYHLNLVYGRYTAACTWYESIFRHTVVGNTYFPKDMHPELVSVVQEAAHQAVLHPFQVTDMSSYKPSYSLYKDATVPTEIRINDLISRMTLEEKIMQLNQYTLGANDVENNKGGEVTKIPAEIGSLIYFETDYELRNRMQRHAMEHSRLGIPILYGYDVIHGFRTIFPIPLAQACSWNPALVEQGCRIAAQESKQSGVDWTFSPMIDVSRDPRWGRVAECYGEDPYANSVFGLAAVRGYQGAALTDSLSIAACLKHYVGYGASEAGRDYVYTEISRQTLWDTYLLPYEKGVRGGAATIMSSFNDISGVPGSANNYTLTEVLRNKWGFRGLVVSDWGAVLQLISQGMAKDLKEAGRLALTAGVDMDMMSHSYDTYLADLVKENKIKPDVMDEAVRRVLRVKFNLGLFEKPYTAPNEEKERFLKPRSQKVAAEISAQSMVLLQNNSALPLKYVKRLAVVGPLADNNRDLLGCWHGHGAFSDVQKVVDYIRNEFQDAEVRYVRGCDFDGNDQSEFAKAFEVARWADAVVMCMGEKGSWSGENNSHSDISLPLIQRQLLSQMRNQTKKMILVLSNGRPMVLDSCALHSDAILEMWQPGTNGADAVAGILSGRINPSGRLSMTFPYSQGQIPIYYNRRNSARATQGFYKDATSAPLFTFGHGLSYTEYKYGNISASRTDVRKGDRFNIQVPVSNVGVYDGMETVFVYISDPYSRITRPGKELKAFQKKLIRKGETESFEFKLEVNRDLGYVDSQGNRIVEPGEVIISIGDQKITINIRE